MSFNPDEMPTELTRDEISALSPDAATATLAAMQKQYVASQAIDKTSPDGIRTMTPAEASAWLADRRPTGADDKPIPAPPYGGIESSHAKLARQSEEVIKHLEGQHFPERGTPVGDDLWNLLDGKTPIEPGLEQKVEAKLKQFYADQAWCTRLMQGDPLTMREWHLATALLTACRIPR